MQPDGKILVGGWFTTMDWQPRKYIARLNPNGQPDGFNPGAENFVSSLVLQADGKILVGGSFINLGGQQHVGLGRLNPDGTLDSGFQASVYPSPRVDSLAVQADGRILVAGRFTGLAGQARNYFGRLNPDGTLDTDFNPAVGASGSGPFGMAVQADGKILILGGYYQLGGRYASISRLFNTGPATQTLATDNSTVTWLRGGTGPEVWRTTFDYSIDGFTWTNLGSGSRVSGGWQLGGQTLSPSGRIRARGYVVGGYQNASGWFVETVLGAPVFLTQPSSLWNGAGTTATFNALAEGSEPKTYQWLKDGVALVDGGNRAGALTPTLTLTNVLNRDEGAYSVVASNSYGSVTSVVARLTVIEPRIIVQPLNQRAEIGDSTTFSVTAVGTALNYQWWKDGAVRPEDTNSMLTLTNVQGNDAGLYAVVVSSPYGSATSAVAKLTVNLATLDAAFKAGVSGNDVYTAVVQADEKVLIGGFFTNIAGQPRINITRLNADGALDPWFNPDLEANSSVHRLLVQSTGKILVSGFFSSIGGKPRFALARINGNGTLDEAFDPRPNNYVGSLAEQSDGKILVGGGFTMNIARLNSDGTLDPAFNAAASNYVYCIAVQSDAKILVGGAFGTLGGQPRIALGRLNPDGTLDNAFNPGINGGYVYTIVQQSDGKILISGSFTSVAGQPKRYFSRVNIDGTLDLAFSPGALLVYSLAIQTDGKILVGGTFTKVAGESWSNLARLNEDGTLDEKFSPSVNGDVFALAEQANGQILVGGAFTTLAGKPRTYLGQLNNTQQATQSL